MKVYGVIVSLLFAISVGINIWQWNRPLNQANNATSPENIQSSAKQITTNPISAQRESVSLNQPPSAQVLAAEVNSYLQQGDIAIAKTALFDALRFYPDSIPLLLLEAQIIKATEPLANVVIYYYDLLERNLPPSDERWIQGQIQQLTESTIDALTSVQAWTLLAQFIEPLFQRQSTHREYIYTLAKAYAKQQKTSLMEDILASVYYHDPMAQRIRKMAYDGDVNQPSTELLTDNSERKFYTLPLFQNGDHYNLEVKIGERNSEWLIDTGASISAITPPLYQQLSQDNPLQELGRFEVNTASGSVIAPLVKLPTLQVGRMQFTDISVLVLPTELHGAEGLLGMNILRQTTFMLDQINNELRYTLQ